MYRTTRTLFAIVAFALMFSQVPLLGASHVEAFTVSPLLQTLTSLFGVEKATDALTSVFGSAAVQTQVAQVVGAGSGFVIYVDNQLTTDCLSGNYSIVSRSCTGSDGNAYTTIQKAADVTVPGTTVYVREGIYRENVVIKHSGTAQAPITYEAYQQEDAVVDGSDSVTGWQRCASATACEGSPYWTNIYVAEIPNTTWHVFEDGSLLTEARTPNFGYYTATPDIATRSFVDSALTLDPSKYVGAYVSWQNTDRAALIDRLYKVVSARTGAIEIDSSEHMPSYGTVIWDDDPESKLVDTPYYYLTNKVAFLDRPGEYVIDENATPPKIYVWPQDSGAPDDVTYATRMNGIQSVWYEPTRYVVFDGIDVKRTNFSASGNKGIGYLIEDGSEFVTIRNAEIMYTKSGISFHNDAQGMLVENNKVMHNRRTGIGQGGGKNGPPIDPVAWNVIRNNEVAYNPDNITMYSTAKVLIENNHIHHGVGDYTHSDNVQGAWVKDILIKNNLIHDGGQNIIYQWTENLDIVNNVIYNSGANTFVLDRDSNINTTLRGNTVGMSRYGMSINSSSIGTTVLQDNIFALQKPNAPRDAFGLMGSGAIASDYNWFPANITSIAKGGTYYPVSDWQAAGNDVHSHFHELHHVNVPQGFYVVDIVRSTPDTWYIDEGLSGSVEEMFAIGDIVERGDDVARQITGFVGSDGIVVTPPLGDDSLGQKHPRYFLHWGTNTNVVEDYTVVNPNVICTGASDGSYVGAMPCVDPPSTETVPPSAVTDLVASVIYDTTVVLAWSPSTDNTGVEGYTVMRDGVLVGVTDQTIFSDTSVTPSTLYEYTVKAFDASDNESVPASLSITSNVVGESGPLLHLPLDGNIQDYSTHNALVTWSGTPTYTTGHTGQAISLSNTEDAYVLAEHAPQLDGMDELHLSLWAKKHTEAVGGTLLHKHVTYWLGLTNDDVNAYVGTESGLVRVGSRLPADNGTEWHHYEITYDGAVVRLYIDGNEVDSEAATGKVSVNPTRDISIGKDPWGDSFDGVIDEIVLKNKVGIVEAGTTPTATLSASPSSITEGDSSTLTWTSTDATSCLGTGFSTGNATAGSVSVSPTSDTTYTVSCAGAGGTDTDRASVTVTDSAGDDFVHTQAELLTALQNAHAGDTIRLAPGNYGTLSLYTARETWAVFPGEVTITSADTNNKAAFDSVLLNGVEHLTFDDILFDYDAAPGVAEWARPFNISSSKYITIRNSVFDGDVGEGTGSVGDGFGTGFGVAAGASENIVIENNIFYSWMRGGVFGQTDHLVVRSNEIYDIRSDGLDFAQVTDVTIEGNYLHDFRKSLGSGDHMDMIQFWTSGTDTPTEDVVIRDNVLMRGAGDETQSIFMRNEVVDQGLAGYEMYYRNLLIEDNLIHNAHTHGITTGETDELVIRNNTLLENFLTGNSVHIPSINVNANSLNVTVENNIAPRYSIPESAQATNNMTVQRADRNAPNFIPNLFVDGTGDDTAVSADLQALPLGDIEQAGAGAAVTTFNPTPDTLTTLFVRESDNTVGEPSRIHFDASLTADGQGYVDESTATFNWDFGDGTTAQGTMVQHTYTLPGTYTVTLTVTKNGVSDTNESRVTIPDPVLLKLVFSDNGVNDLSSYEAQASYDPALYATAPGLIDRAFHLNGDNTIAFSRENTQLWGHTQISYLFALKRDSATAGGGHIVYQHVSQNIRLLDNGEISFYLRNHEGTEFTLTTTGANISDTEWHHVVLSYDGVAGVATFYVDGAPAGSMSMTGDTRPIEYWGETIGNPWGGTASFNGLIDMFEYRGDVLDQTSVTERYQEFVNLVNGGTPTPLPTTSLTASPVSITEGQSSTLTWNSTNATVCTGTGFLTNNNASGSVSVTPSSDTTYTLACTGDGGSASDSATVYVEVPDTTAPVITNVAVSNITDTTATITWNTDELATSKVIYGRTSSYGSETTETTSVTTSHSVTLTSLSRDSLYHFSVMSRDAEGNQAVSGDDTFTTLLGADTTSPNITITAPSNNDTVSGTISIEASADDPTVTGETTSGIAQVTFVLDGGNLSTDATAPYSTGLDTTSLTDGIHTITATAVDNVGHTASDSVTVTVDNAVEPPADTTPPVISNVVATNSNGSDTNGHLITWTTNEPATSVVHYGTNRNSLDMTASSNTFTESHSIELSPLTPKTRYYYQVSSTDSAGNASESSVESFRTSGKPNKVKNIRARSGSVILEWDVVENTDEIVIIRLEGRKTADTDDTPLATLSGDATEYRDETARDNITYTYTVYTVLDGIYSDPSTVTFKKEKGKPTLTQKAQKAIAAQNSIQSSNGESFSSRSVSENVSSGSGGGGSSSSRSGSSSGRTGTSATITTTNRSGTNWIHVTDADQSAQIASRHGFKAPYFTYAGIQAPLMKVHAAGDLIFLTAGAGSKLQKIYKYARIEKDSEWHDIELSGIWPEQNGYLTGKGYYILRPGDPLYSTASSYIVNIDMRLPGCSGDECFTPGWRLQQFAK